MASNPIQKSPFSDAIADSVPYKGTKGGEYDKSDNAPGLPGRDGGYFAELHRDTAATSGQPGSGSGPIQKSPFKDSVD